MTELKDLQKLKAYEVVSHETLNDIDSIGYVLKHKKTGAKVAVVSNNDENKTFYIGFKTTPENDTGVAHITEHTVLCGSDKFPVKDPFVELVKGSLNTFLNAMTYPDKTLYPVASCNDKDFKNLMDVYLDAVFHPNIYKYRQIFEQEGWHYEMESADSDITVNGVVYNEMKGAYSSVDSILEREIYRSLFPDNTYSRDSGGDPEAIGSLTYEYYLDFHRRYYHPSNSYIYLYGDMDAAKQLEWIDEEYLSGFDYLKVNSDIKKQSAFDKMNEVFVKYPVSSEEPLENNTFLSYNMVIADVLDRELYNAFELLEYVLLDRPGAPLKEALLKGGIGRDVYGSYDNGVLQPVFEIVAKNANKEDADKFLEIINSVFKEQAEGGLDHEALLATVTASEFRYREADFGAFPKGLIYGIQLLDSWLYDDGTVFDHVKEGEIYALLREKIDTGYFEELIKKYLLNNTHSSLIIMEPDREMNDRREAALKDKLKDLKASLSEDEIEEIVKHTAFLKKYQEEPSPEEDLKKIPMLKREDLKKEINPLNNDERRVDDSLVLYHDEATNGIVYINYIFDTRFVTEEDLPYVGILKNCLRYMDTEKHSYNELTTEINKNLGGIGVHLNAYSNANDRKICRMKMSVRAKALKSQINEVEPLVSEIIFKTKLDDENRLKDILSEVKSKLQTTLSSYGNSVAATRAMSYFSKGSKFSDATNGIAFYRVVSDYEKNFDAKKRELIDKLKELSEKIFVKNKFMISITCDSEGYDMALPGIETFIGKLKMREDLPDSVFTFEKKNEGFMDASQIQYVARAGNFKNAGLMYNGAMKVLKVILGYDYLWTNIRVKGGAYGCGGGLHRSGNGYLSSYRDPNLKETNEIYDNLPAYLENFNADERDMTKFVIGTMSDLDVPLTPFAKGQRSLQAYLTDVTEETLEKERKEVLEASVEDIRKLAPAMKAVLDEQCICVIGNESKLKENKDMFKNLESLL
ncbi:MAG: insulinase family protein [Lachnospiraceae bacterium]|nr:insulinase family protein [Lachnospiraceae bacterium]